MHSALINRVRSWYSFLAPLCLFLSWVIGICAGLLFCRSSGQLLFLLMCGSFRSTVSIVMLLAGLMLPFLITALVVRYNKLHILFPVCAAKAFGYSLVVFTVYGTYGRCGWLMHLLLLFSNNISVFFLLTIWLYVLSARGKAMMVVIRYWVIMLFVWGFDMIYIAPFVESLMSL